MVCGLAADSDSAHQADNRLPAMRLRLGRSLCYSHATSLIWMQQSLSVTPCLEMCHLRRRFAEQFAGYTGTDRIYLRIYIGDRKAFYSDNIS